MSKHERRNEHDEQHIIESIAQSRFPECTGVEDIQPFLTGNEQSNYWLVTLATRAAFCRQITLVTSEDIRSHQQQNKL